MPGDHQGLRGLALPDISPEEFDRVRLSEADNQRIFLDEIVPFHLEGAAVQSAPHLVVVGGATGSGKSSVTDLVRYAFDRRGGALHINMDDFNPHHPNYTMLRRSAPEKAGALLWSDGLSWWNKAQEYAHHPDRRNDVVIESALRGPDEFENILERFGERGYRLNTALMGVPEAVSLQGGLHRYVAAMEKYGVGRYVEPEIHRECYEGVERAARAIDAGRPSGVGVVFFQRGGISNTPSGGMPAVERLTVERGLPLGETQAGLFKATQEGMRSSIVRNDAFSAREKRKLLSEVDEIDRLAQPLMVPSAAALLVRGGARRPGPRGAVAPRARGGPGVGPDRGTER